MGDIKAFNSAGANDPVDTVTTVNGTTARAIDLFITETDIENIRSQVESNTQHVQEVVQGAPDSLNTFKEVSDELDLDAFLDALNGTTE